VTVSPVHAALTRCANGASSAAPGGHAWSIDWADGAVGGGAHDLEQAHARGAQQAQLGGVGTPAVSRRCARRRACPAPT
jgi:hypothetical protein